MGSFGRVLFLFQFIVRASGPWSLKNYFPLPFGFFVFSSKQALFWPADWCCSITIDPLTGEFDRAVGPLGSPLMQICFFPLSLNDPRLGKLLSSHPADRSPISFRKISMAEK